MLKMTQLFQCGTIDKDGNAARIGGFSESWYSDLTLSSSQLNTQWGTLCRLRAALLPENCRIVGQRLAEVDPVGASRGYDSVYPGTQTSANDLPQVALQWTMRSTTGFNNRQVTLRAVPDVRVLRGEYNPSDVFNAALAAYFAELSANWKMRAIDRTVLPVKIVSIAANGAFTTEKPHGLTTGDTAQVMSTEHGSDHVKHSFNAYVSTASGSSGTLIVPRALQETLLVGGRIRKYAITYPNVRINSDEVINPTAVIRKVGSPFKKFVGRRTARKS